MKRTRSDTNVTSAIRQKRMQTLAKRTRSRTNVTSASKSKF